MMKKMCIARKVLVWIMMLTTAFILFACTSSSSPAGSAGEGSSGTGNAEGNSGDVKPASEADKTKTNSKSYEFGYAVSNMSHEWYQNVVSGAKRRAEERGVKLTVSDAAMDSGKQQNYAENFITQKVDALILTPVDPSTMGAIVTLANESNVPLIAEASHFDGETCFVGITDYDAALEMGGWMASYAKENNIDMKLLIVGQPIYEACVDRVKGFLAGLDAAGAKYEIVQEVDGNGTKEDSLRVCNDALIAHPEVNVIFGINDNSSTGGMNAYTELGYDTSKLTVLGFGFEGSVGRDALLDPKSPYKAAVAMFPDYVGAALIDGAVMTAEGNAPKVYRSPTTIITRDNFSEYYTDNGDGTYTTNFKAIDALLKK